MRQWAAGIAATLGVGLLTAYGVGVLDAGTDFGPNSLHAETPEIDTAPEQGAAAVSEYAGGWGPARKMFTMQKPSGYAVLNSISDSRHGDERNFVQVRNLSRDEMFSDETTACVGDVVEVYFYFHNAVSDHLAGNSSSTIYQLRARILTGSEGSQHSVGVHLSAENVKSVWDGAKVHCGSSDVALAYVEDSALLFSEKFPSGKVIPGGDFNTTSAMTIGTLALDGRLPAGSVEGFYAANGYVTFEMKVVEKS